MKLKAAMIVIACLLLSACGIPVPPEKTNYVGEWKGLGMSLIITPDGGVAYERISGSGTNSVKGPLKAFDGDNFVVGILFVSTTFVVSKPPYEENGEWKMVVDGVELIRQSGTPVQVSTSLVYGVRTLLRG